MDVIIKKEVFKSENGINIIVEAEVDGDLCYIATHNNYDHKEIFDHDRKVLNAVKRKIKRDGVYICDHKTKCDIFRFRKKGKKASVSLRYIVYGKYNGIATANVKGMKIVLLDDSLQKYNISDLRSCNLYDAGGYRPHTDTRSIEIKRNPYDENDKYIFITFHDVNPERVEKFDYEKELYEMFTQRRYCNIQTGIGNGRGMIGVHHAHTKDGYCVVNLARFVAIYKYHFWKYRKRKGSVKQFIRDFKKLNNAYEKADEKRLETSHINSCKTNNCMGNLMFMPWRINNHLDNHIKYFDGNHNVFTVLNDKEEILIEFIAPDYVNGGRVKRYYYKCPAPEDFLFWQQMFLGELPLTERLSRVTFVTESGHIEQALTPRGMVLSGLVGDGTARNNEPDFWEWVEHSKRLKSLPGEMFTICERNNYDICIIADEESKFDPNHKAYVIGKPNGEAFVVISPV